MFRQKMYEAFAELNNLKIYGGDKTNARYIAPKHLRPTVPRHTWAVLYDPIVDHLHKWGMYDHPHWFKKNTKDTYISVLTVEYYIGEWCEAETYKQKAPMKHLGVNIQFPRHPFNSMWNPGKCVLAAISSFDTPIIFLLGSKIEEIEKKENYK